MSEDYFDVAYINHDEAILHGKRADQSEVRIVLTDAQMDQIEDLNSAHQIAMQKLLRGFAA